MNPPKTTHIESQSDYQARSSVCPTESEGVPESNHEFESRFSDLARRIDSLLEVHTEEVDLPDPKDQDLPSEDSQTNSATLPVHPSSARSAIPATSWPASDQLESGGQLPVRIPNSKPVHPTSTPDLDPQQTGVESGSDDLQNTKSPRLPEVKPASPSRPAGDTAKHASDHTTAVPSTIETECKAAQRTQQAKCGTVMIVDDEEINILAVRKYLKTEGYENFLTTTDARQAIGMMRTESPDVILLDVNMPDVSGLDVLRAVRLDSTLEHIPIIILTASTDLKTKRQALEQGAYDFLTKPVDPIDLSLRIRNALTMKGDFDEISEQAARLEEIVHRRTEELFQSRQQLILSLARAAEHRDNDTGNHVLRVGQFAAIIAKELGWKQDQVELLEQAAQLHDVGKIGISDDILFKPGKLEPEEFGLMKRHCVLGREIIEPMSEKEFQVMKMHARLGESMLHVRSSPMLMMASKIAQTHHEWWDGTGYPLGLAGEDIPLEGRVTAVADVYDALSSKRSYKEAFPREKCFRILKEGHGSHFDPEILDAFFARSEEIIEVQLRCSDRE